MNAASSVASKNAGTPSVPKDRSGFRKRREPRQVRSRSTVEAIKQAAVMLASERGFGSLSTEQIAERAGVNIGSLYQYFPNREAIFLSVHEDMSAKLLESMKTLTVDIFDMPMERAAYLAMERLLATLEKHRLVLLDLVAELPQLDAAAQPASYHSLSRGGIRTFVQHRMVKASAKDVQRRAFFIEHIALGCIQRYLIDRPRMTRKEFLKELAWLLTVYVNKPAQGS